MHSRKISHASIVLAHSAYCECISRWPSLRQKVSGPKVRPVSALALARDHIPGAGRLPLAYRFGEGSSAAQDCKEVRPRAFEQGHTAHHQMGRNRRAHEQRQGNDV